MSTPRKCWRCGLPEEHPVHEGGDEFTLGRGLYDHDFETTPRKLTRHERLQLAADAGRDTWDDYRGER